MKSKRQANFELLRIVAMMMIIVLHYLNKGNLLAVYTADRSLVNYVAHLTEAFCIVAVNCYVLLSGYFLVESAWKPGRVVSLAAQVLFYSLLVPVILIGVGVIPAKELSVYDWLGFVLPVETEHYWFATAYLIMYVFAPLLAAGVRKLEKKTLQMIIGILVLYYSVWKSIVPALLATDRYGYDYGWFLCLFLIAAYIRLYGLPVLERKRNAAFLYVGMSLGIFLLTTVAGMLAGRVTALEYYRNMPTTYNHMLCLAGSVGLFMVFKDMRPFEGRIAAVIRWLAPYTFGVYLLHEHILVRYEWMRWLRVDAVQGSWMFVPHMIGCVLLVYIVGTAVDFLRQKIFDGIERVLEFDWKQTAMSWGSRVSGLYDNKRNVLENIIFPMVLILYPLVGIRQGIDVSDTAYSLSNFQYFTSMDGTWIVATFLANAVGRLLICLPFGDTLMGMYFYTSLVQSVIALSVYRALKRRMPAVLVFLGEVIALGLCWCPSVLLYNYLTYLLMTAGILLLYEGIIIEKEETVFRERNFKRHLYCRYYVLAGICLGVNVAVRMPNVVQAAFILAVWYGVFGGEGSDKWKRVIRDTLWCIAGYFIGFGVPFVGICIRYGMGAYPSMVQTMFAMTEKATDYKPTSMLTGMFGDYLTGSFWLIFALACMTGGWALFMLRRRFLADCRWAGNLCGIIYVAVLCVLLRLYWGRGVFSFRYYEYSSMYYPAVLLLIVAALTAVLCLRRKDMADEGRVLAVLILVQMFVTPLGSNNDLYPIINNLFLVLPFVLWTGYLWSAGSSVVKKTATECPVTKKTVTESYATKKTVTESSAMKKAVTEPSGTRETVTESLVTKKADTEFSVTKKTSTENSVMKSVAAGQSVSGKTATLPMWEREPGLFRIIWVVPFIMLVVFVMVQSVGFHVRFSFQDGIEGEARDSVATAPAKAKGVYTTQENAAWLSELAEFAKDTGLTGKEVLLYGEVPGLGYLLDMPSALSTFWPDLDSYRMVEYERDMAQMEEPPVIIVSSQVAAYLSEDADGMNWFGVDQEKLDADEKLQILGQYMDENSYEEAFANGRYVVYVTEE